MMKGLLEHIRRNALPYAGILLFSSISCLRLDLLPGLQMKIGPAFAMGMYLGVWYDALFILFFGAVALGARAFRAPLRPTLVTFAALLWVPALSNALYFSYFGVGMEWWIVKYYWKNSFEVADSARSMGSSLYVLASTILFALTVWVLRHTRFQIRRRSGFMILVLALPVFLLARQSPHWFGLVPFKPVDSGPIFATHILRIWFDEAIGNTRNKLKPDAETPAVLAKFSAQKDLYRDFEPTHRQYWLRRLNLKGDRPINVVFLFMESSRAYEFQHPEMGPAIFPRLHKIFKNNGVVFSNAYTSALNAGQTVRGRFATLCSMLSNIGGPAVSIAHPTTRLVCLTDLLAKTDYLVYSMVAYDLNFHNKRIFETFHGVTRFVGEKTYRQRGLKKQVGTWGLADHEVLLENMRILEEEVPPGHPYVADMTTVSTHHPFTVVPEGPVPKKLLLKHADKPGYQGFLSRMSYADRSAGEFLKEFFARPISDNTLVVVLADHSVPLPPPGLEHDHRRRTEVFFRIPLALLTKHPREPGVLHHPVHQADVTPTVASILGLQGKVTFLGRNLASRNATPFIFQQPNSEIIYYRTNKQACYWHSRGADLDCYKLRGTQDPMFADILQKTIENRDLTRFFRKVVRSNNIAVRHNLFIPRITPTSALQSTSE